MESTPRRGIRGAVALVALAASAALLPGSALGYSYVSTPLTVNDSSQAGGDVHCGAGKVAISGGVDGNGGYAEGIYLNSSRWGAVGNQWAYEYWTVWVDNYTGGASSIDTRIHAVCDTAGADKYEHYFYPAQTVPDDTQSEVTRAGCTLGGVAVGGGVLSSGTYPDETYLTTSTVGDWSDADTKPDDGWSYAMNNDEGGDASDTATAYVVCDTKRRASDFAWRTGDRMVPDAEQRTLSVRCGDGQRLVGGGVESRSKYRHGLYINSNFPKVGDNGPGKWVARVDNYDTPDNDARKIVVTAICRK